MKIIYSIGNRVGSDIVITRIKNKLSQNHIVKIGAYTNLADYDLNDLFIGNKKNSELKKLFKDNHFPRANYEKVKNLIYQIEEFNPDFIICDFEHILANIANVLSISLWYCSPLHLLDGTFQQASIIKRNLLDSIRKQLSFLPKAERTFIYSPFGDLDNVPKLRSGFDWISSYSENIKEKKTFVDNFLISDNLRQEKLRSMLGSWIFEDQIILDGNTSFLSDALYYFSGNIFISPDYSNPEQILNALLCQDLGIATNLGQLEKSQCYNLDDIVLFHHKTIKPKHPFLEEFLI